MIGTITIIGNIVLKITTIQISDAEGLTKNKGERGLRKLIKSNRSNSKTATQLNYRTHPQAIYTSRLLNYPNLPKPKNEVNFEKELEGVTTSASSVSKYHFKFHIFNIIDLILSRYLVASRSINMRVPYS